jgi:PLP dependent protein
MSALAERLQSIRRRIASACDRSGRPTASVELMGVSKNHPPEAVAEAVQLGLTLFGENRIQEARTKIPLSPPNTRWHFIGHLQSNKARDAVALFETIQGVDSLELARELQKQAQKQSRRVAILAEVNVAGESTKFGWNPEALLAALPAMATLDHLELKGLMTIAPYAPNPEPARPVFRRLRELRDQCEHQLQCKLPILSMGMSGDLEVAIEEGATLVRVGTALFGDRPRPPASTSTPSQP